MPLWRILFCCVVLFSEVHLPGAEESGPLTVLDVEPAVERERLRSDLLTNYDRTRVSGKMTVAVFYDLQHILGLDEKDQILSVNGILELSWTDPHLKWDPESYSGITDVRLGPESVWFPELQATFNVRPLRIYDEVRSPPVIVSSDGSVRWNPQVRFDVPCSANYRHYPFDSHKCSLILVDDTVDSRRVVLSTKGGRSIRSGSVQGTEWLLRELLHSVEVQQNHPFYRITVGMHLERTSRIYRYVCVIPTVVAMVTLLCGFWLLPDETTRYVIGCANVVVLSMLLQHLAVTVPAGRVVPLIAQYSASCLCLSAIFVVLTVANNLLRTSRGTAPGYLLRLAHLSAKRPLCLFVFSHTSGQEGTSETTPPDEVKRRNDWLLVSVLVDRLTFWCFTFVFVVLLAVLAAV